MQNHDQNRRYHPVVDRFITTDLPLQAIISQACPSPAPPMASAILHMSDCLDGRLLARDAIETAKAVPLKGQDPELTILFLTRWAELAARLSNAAEALVLLHQARSLLSEKPHAEIVATIDFAMSVLEDARGNQSEREALLNRIATALPEHSPRRKFYLWELGFLLARQGRGAEFKPQINQLTWQTSERFQLDQVDRLLFIDAVETGQIRVAAERMAAIAVSSKSNPSARKLYREYQLLLNHMHEVLSPPTSQPGCLPGEQPLPDAPVWLQTLLALKNKDAAAALRLARLEAKRSLNSIFGTGFMAFNLIRAELSSGNAEAARRLLDMRQSRGNTHYLDCFFIARCEWASGNQREAIQRFREALNAVEQYHAQGRMDFELALAVDITAAHALELTRKASAIKTTPQEHAPVQSGLPSSSTEAASTQGTDNPSSVPIAPPLIIGRSPAVLQLRGTISQMAVLDTLVLITGETGTGKELVAAALHRQSARARQPFIAVNCGSISETLLESELFGHQRGSFTGADRTTHGLFEDAGEGTLFLDEIGDVSPRLQAVLLRVLETGEIRAIGSSLSRRIHCRILAATNANLEQRVAEGRFRQDLLYRLQRLSIHIPPLRERRQDIMPLARFFLDKGRPPGTHAKVSSAFSQAVRDHDWPGNVRELRNVIERLRLTHSDKLDYDAADLEIRHGGAQIAPDTEHSRQPAPVSGTDVKTETRGRTETDAVSRFLHSGQSTLRRTERLRMLFREHRRLTRAEVVHLLEISPNTATKYLQQLCQEGLVCCIDPSASSRSRYFEIRDISQAVGPASP